MSILMVQRDSFLNQLSFLVISAMSFPPDYLHSLWFTKMIFSLDPYRED